LKDSLEVYLKDNISANVSINPWNGKEWLPLFLTERYAFYQMNLLGESCLLIKIIREAPGIDDMRKHMKAIRKNFEGSLVFLFKSISLFRRKSLVEHRIPFIVENGQMYLPFLGIDFKKATKEQVNQIEKFASSTQLVFLYFLYQKNLRINATELAMVLNVSAMTASRILNDLYTLGLLTYEISGKTGRSKEYQRIGDPEYYRRGGKYLKNPVIKVVYMEKIPDDYPVAGLEALSKITMINPPKRRVRAVSKQKLSGMMEHIIKNLDQIADQDLAELQIWEYEPGFLATEKQVDIVSLAMSVSELRDDRVEQAIEERLKDERWYTG
jgi:hypothetical protein